MSERIKKVSALLGVDDPVLVARRIEEEVTFRLTKEKYKYYEPNGKCEEFIRAVGSGDYFVVLFSAANGVGKTAAGANVVANITCGSRNPYFDGKLFENWPFPKNGRIVTDPKNTEGNVDTLKEWMRDGKYTTKKAGKSYESQWRTKTGWKWDMMTYEQSAKEFEGPTLGWVWFDEPPTREIYKACVSRLRKGGIIFITATMLKGSGWMFDHIVEGRSDDEELQALAKGQRKYIEAPVEAACKEHGVRGHLNHADIEKMVAEYDEDEKQARVYGKFQHLVGLVFKTFSRQIHVIKPFDINPRQYCVYEFLDPHPRNPDAVMWVAVNRKGQKFIVDELYIKCQEGAADLARNIKQKNSSFRVVQRFCDPSAFIVDQHTERSLASRLADHGLDYLEASKTRTASDKRIQEALGYVQLPTGEFIKEPEFYIFDNCKRTIFEFEHYRWDEWSGKTGENRDAKEKPVDKDDHMVENLGRCLIMEPPFVTMPLQSAVPTAPKSYDPYEQPAK